MRYLLACAVLLVCHAAGAVQVSRDGLQSFFDTAFTVQAQDHELAGLVVAVVQDGEVVFESGYGWADIENRIAVDPDENLFRIASITKLFVWTAIMQLYEQGQLDLDDDVNDHLVAFKVPSTFSEPVRIRHLLTHTPGFEDSAIGMNARTLADTLPLGEYLAERMPLRVRPPGQFVAYSNYGTTLAAYIVGQVSGQPWDAYVDEHILAPLAMTATNTHAPVRADLMPRLAKSYVFSGGRFMAKPYEAMNDAPAGIMATTARDMARFMLAHLGDGELDGQRILRPETAARMMSPLHEVHPAVPPMLHGFYRMDRNGVKALGHGGDTNQFHSQLMLIPAHQLGVFVSFNAESGDVARDRLMAAFMDHFFPVEYLRPAPRPTSLLADDYSGEYIPLRSNRSTIERLGTLVTGTTVDVAAGKLTLAGEASWVAAGPDEFVAEYKDRRLVFLRDGDGNVSHMVVGSPLSTYFKVSGLDAPGNQRLLIGLMLLVALAALGGYGYQLVFGGGTGIGRLPAILGCAHGLLTAFLYLTLVVVLSGDVTAFVLGVPPDMHKVLWLMLLNAVLGVVVVLVALRLLAVGPGSTMARLRFGVVGLMALINLWVVWYFNILTYPLSGLPVISGQ